MEGVTCVQQDSLVLHPVNAINTTVKIIPQSQITVDIILYTMLQTGGGGVGVKENYEIALTEHGNMYMP